MKWKKFNQDAPDYQEYLLQNIFDNIQNKVNENKFCIMNTDLWRYGLEKFMGYTFYPEIKKFLAKIVNCETHEIQYVIRYAKDLESCEINCGKEFDYSDEYDLDIQVIAYPFQY